MNNQLERANRAWEILASCAKAKKTITYGQIAKVLVMHHRPVRFVLAPIQDYCLEKQLPPLTILVVNLRGRPGPGFFAWDTDRFDEGLEEVYSYPGKMKPTLLLSEVRLGIITPCSGICSDRPIPPVLTFMPKSKFAELPN